MHEQVTIGIWYTHCGRKDLNWCMPFGVYGQCNVKTHAYITEIKEIHFLRLRAEMAVNKSVSRTCHILSLFGPILGDLGLFSGDLGLFWGPFWPILGDLGLFRDLFGHISGVWGCFGAYSGLFWGIWGCFGTYLGPYLGNWVCFKTYLWESEAVSGPIYAK